MSTQHQQETARVRHLSGVRFVEVSVADGSTAAGRLVREVSWPPRTVITSIRKQADVVVPTGETELHGGDVLVVLTVDEAIQDLHGLTGQGPDAAAEPG